MRTEKFHSHGRAFGRRLFLWGCLIVIICGAVSLSRWSQSHALMINRSESLPYWAFFVEEGAFPQRGDVVVFHPGFDPLVVSHFGEEPEAFTKIALGLPGDIIERQGKSVFINGELVGRTKPLTQSGEKLLVGPTGRIPDDCIYAGTGHKDGFDSRYAHIGLVCRDRIVGTGVPLL